MNCCVEERTAFAEYTRSQVRFTSKLYTARCATINPNVCNVTMNWWLMIPIFISVLFLAFRFFALLARCLVCRRLLLFIYYYIQEGQLQNIYPSKDDDGTKQPSFLLWLRFFPLLSFFLSNFHSTSVRLFASYVVLCCCAMRKGKSTITLLLLVSLPLTLLLLLPMSLCRLYCVYVERLSWA